MNVRKYIFVILFMFIFFVEGVNYESSLCPYSFTTLSSSRLFTYRKTFK